MSDENKEPTKARNVTELVFPRDIGGNLGKLKSDALKAISQMNGNIDKYRAFQETLDLLKEFAETRMRIQMRERKSAVASMLAARAVANALADPVAQASKNSTVDQADADTANTAPVQGPEKPDETKET